MANTTIQLWYREGNFCRVAFTREEAVAVANMLMRAVDNQGESKEFGHVDFPEWHVSDDEDHPTKS